MSVEIAAATACLAMAGQHLHSFQEHDNTSFGNVAFLVVWLVLTVWLGVLGFLS